MPVSKEYQQKIRKCPVFERGGRVVVDWSPIFMGQLSPGYEFELGFQPSEGGVSEKGEWVDPDLAIWPPPAWAQSAIYIDYLEARVAELEKKA